MLMQCVSAVCVLGVVMVGLLVMVQAISLEELGRGMWRGFLLAVAALVGLCVLRGSLLPILTRCLVALKQLMWWAFVIVLAVIATLLLLKVLITKFATRLSADQP